MNDIDAKFNDVKAELYAAISDLMKRHAYEANDQKLRNKIASDALDCLYAFVKKHDLPLHCNSAICDESNNTAETIDKNELNLDMTFKFSESSDDKHISWKMSQQNSSLAELNMKEFES